jgi:hypothetical protein
LDWAYISGFFDGEGGITIDAPKDSRVLVLTVGIAQKSKEVLEIIAGFLRTHGISSRFFVSGPGINNPRIGRIKDIISFLSRLTLTVKARQAAASLDYLRGRISGNELLSIFKEEYLAGKRRFAPFVRREWNFSLTHEEANRLAELERARASATARKCLRPADLRAMVVELPLCFGIQDVALALAVPKQRASYIVKLMRREGLIVGELHYHSHTRTLVCKRII